MSKLSVWILVQVGVRRQRAHSSLVERCLGYGFWGLAKGEKAGDAEEWKEGNEEEQLEEKQESSSRSCSQDNC